MTFFAAKQNNRSETHLSHRSAALAMTHIDPKRFGPWALVTGASSGLGAEFARQLAASGLNLVLVARRLSVLDALGRKLATAHGIGYRAVRADLSSPDFMDALQPATEDIEVGLLVSNAGTGTPGSFFAVPEAVHVDIVHLNALSYMRLAHFYGRPMAERGRGGIVLVGAMGAMDGIPYMANAAASKAFVTSLGKGLHAELGPMGVRTTVMIPGPTDTPIFEKFGLDRAALPVAPLSAEQCVAEGLQALNAGRATHLTGRLNRIVSRFVPASVTRRLSGKMLSAGLINGAPRLDHLSVPVP